MERNMDIKKKQEEQKKQKKEQEEENNSDISHENSPKTSPVVKYDPGREINVEFYTNKLSSVPNGDFIDNIHTKWKGNNELLEKHHGYIQWLFPIQTGSIFNMSSRPIKKSEIKRFKTDINIAKKVVKSYEFMLEFYGMEILDHKTGMIGRRSDYLARYRNGFIQYIHNHLRITRILTFLNLVGFRKYAIELVKFLDKEIFMGNERIKQQYLKLDRPKEEQIKLLISRISDKAPLRAVLKHSGYRYWQEMGKMDLRLNENKMLLLNKLKCTMEELREESVYFSTLQ